MGEFSNPTLFDDLPPGEEKNIPLLLDRLYGRVNAAITNLRIQVGGRLGQHEGWIAKVDQRLMKVENCPCAVHRDPAHTCVILDIQDTLAGIEARMNKQIAAMERRLAWWGGAVAVLIVLLEVGSRILPLVWR